MMKVLEAGPAAYEEAVAYLRAGEVVAYPTETVYGLAVDPHSEAALQRLFAVKGRPESNPVLMVVADIEQLSALVGSIPETTQRLMEAFWPGPLSLLFPAPPALPQPLSVGSGKICLRCPAAPIARELCRYFGGAITSTSANRSGEAPARSPEALEAPGVALCIHGGACEDLEPSTIYDPERDTILREGPITREMLDEALKR